MCLQPLDTCREGKSKGGWIAKLAEELAGGGSTKLAVEAAEELSAGPAGTEHGHAAAGSAATATEELLRNSRLVLAFPHSSGSTLLSIHQASSVGAQAVVVCLSEAGAPHAQQRPLAAFTLPGASAVLGGGSVADWWGGLCRPYLLVRATTGHLRLLEALPQQRRARTVWEAPDRPQVSGLCTFGRPLILLSTVQTSASAAPNSWQPCFEPVTAASLPFTLAGTACCCRCCWLKGELVQPLVHFRAGPSVVLPFTSGELWVACNYGGPPPGLGQPPGASGWQLHRLRVGVGSALVPCAVWPCWSLSAGPCSLAGPRGGHPSASTATHAGAPGSTAAVRRSADTDPGSGGAGVAGSGLCYYLAAVVSVGQQQAQQQPPGEQQQGQARGSMMLVCLQLAPGSCPGNACHILHLPPLSPPAGSGVGGASAAAYLIPQQRLSAQEGHSRAMLAVSTHSGQVHLLALAGLPAGECFGGAASAGGAAAPVAAWQQQQLVGQGGSSAQVNSGPAAWTASAMLPAPATQLTFVRGSHEDKGEQGALSTCAVFPASWRHSLHLGDAAKLCRGLSSWTYMLPQLAKRERSS